ncbi:MAG: hypothetical protein WCF57_03720 [Pyrinomonadaceae bacterium]
MKLSKIITGCICAIMLSPNLSFAQGWRGIEPLHSTCEDVRRILSTVKCESSTYYLEDEVVDIGFSQKPCHEKWPYETWNVPPGTVTDINIRPKKQTEISDLGINIGDFQKARDEYSTNGFVYYNKELGIYITAEAGGRVLEITYLPAAKDNYLRCPGSSEKVSGVGKKSEGHTKFDEYGKIVFNEEKDHLSKFAQLLLQYGTDVQGYIIAYGGRHAYMGDAQARAARAKNFLVTNYSINAQRIVTVDGGYREDPTVELWYGLRSFGAPTIGPTVHPNEVQIIDKSRKTINRRSLHQRQKHYRLCQ